MRRLAWAIFALFGTIQAASAASFDWSGFYAGFNLGIDAGSSTFTDEPSGNGLAWLEPGDRFTAERTGANFGVEAGYNLQISSFVAGVEGDIGYLGGGGRGESSSPLGAGIFGYIQSGGYATIRARAGLALDRVLVFATAGGIVADHGAYMEDVAYNGLTAKTGWVGGWVAGGGIAYALTDDWTVKLDGLYYDLGHTTVRGADSFAGPTYDVASKGAVVRLGFDYNF